MDAGFTDRRPTQRQLIYLVEGSILFTLDNWWFPNTLTLSLGTMANIAGSLLIALKILLIAVAKFFKANRLMKLSKKGSSYGDTFKNYSWSTEKRKDLRENSPLRAVKSRDEVVLWTIWLHPDPPLLDFSDCAFFASIVVLHSGACVYSMSKTCPHFGHLTFFSLCLVSSSSRW